MLVKRTFYEMRKKDRKASFSDALKEASRRKKRGDL
jgi:predicted CopG family antitoxin